MVGSNPYPDDSTFGGKSVQSSSLKSIVLTDGDFHSRKFDFREFMDGATGVPTARIPTNGNVAICMKVTLTEGADATTLFVDVYPRVLIPETSDLVTCANKIQTLKDDAAFTTNDVLCLPITVGFGPCEGLDVWLKYGNGDPGVKELTIATWLEVE